MGEYTSVKKLYFNNFRNIKEAILSFEDSPILALVGDNDVGKTSIIKGVAVCALNYKPKKQPQYIRHGTNMFGVAIELSDGTYIIRMKTSSINKYEIKKDGKTIWETSKISEGLPIEVQNLIGMIEEPETKEYLNIRTYENKELFADTPDSVNYKVMYNALKVDNLTNAISIGSEEVNDLRESIITADNGVRTLNDLMRKIKVIDIEPLKQSRDRIKQQMNELDLLERAISLKNSINECNSKLGTYRLIETYKLEGIDIELALMLSNISNTRKKVLELGEKLEKYKGLDTIDTVDLSIINQLNSIINKKENDNVLRRQFAVYAQADGLPTVNIDTITKLKNAILYKNNIKDYSNKCSTFDTSGCEEISNIEIDNIYKMLRCINIIHDGMSNKVLLNDIKKEVDKYTNKLIESGVAFETCPNCGSDVLIDLDKLEK